MILVVEIVLLVFEIALAWFILGLLRDLKELRDQIRTGVEDALYRKVEPMRRLK